MATPLADALFGLTILSGAVLCWLGVYCYREWDQPGVRPFAAFTFIYGLGAIIGATAGIADLTLTGIIGDDSSSLWIEIAFFTWLVATLPFFLFGVAYSGKYTRVARRVVVLLALPLAGFLVLLVIGLAGIHDGNLLSQLFGTLTTFYVIFLLFVGIYLVVRTTHVYGHTQLVQGLCIGMAGLLTFLGFNTAAIFRQEIGELPAIAIYAGGSILPTLLLVAAVFRYDMFDSSPAAGTIGEDAFIRETDDLVFIVDESEQIIKLNPKAAESFDSSQADAVGESLQSVLHISLDELREMETYELRTALQKRQFDPEVSAYTDEYGRSLGYIVRLHDVTERELRKQRLAVLNRVLRHNLRNSVDVIKSNAEVLSEQPDDVEFTTDRAETIIDSVDGLASLGQKARSIDRFVSRSVRETERDLTTVLTEIIDQVRTDLTNGTRPLAEIEYNHPASAPLVTDWQALTAALESAIENAIEHAEQRVVVSIEEYDTGYRITISDDGTGIPASELATLDAGRETPLRHGSGLGLWQIQWGITKLNGTVSFDTSDGTTIELTVPHESRT